ncbi:MAG: xanthine dehydrogenase FAD-binding subunit XdhB [Christensenellaceae bacterium]|nr:xanthine dehydrogenase FAD-binding subunit XdhB [Christensenellaceae bacterium]
MYDFKALYEAGSIKEAVELRKAHPDALILAGGSDILIKLREGKMKDVELISIYGIDELRGVSLDADETLRIRPLTSFSHVTKDALINKIIPVLGEAADRVGSPQIRNIGTIGGNVCNGVTSADTANTLFSWNAYIELTGEEGKRIIPIAEFYLGAGKTDVRPTEIMTSILIKKEDYEGYFGKYQDYNMRSALDIATLGCSVSVKLSEDKKVAEDVRIAYGVAAPTPIRAKNAEAKVKGQKVSEEMAELLKTAVLEDINPRTSWRAKKELREHLAGELCYRAYKDAVVRAGGVI